MSTPPAVAAFTDTYLPTVNGVTYTIRTWRDRWHARGGRMPVVYPDGDHRPERDEHPVSSVAFPFYEGFRAAIPWIPSLDAVDLVHAHTPFSLGLAARRLAGRRDVPLIASYHTPTAEYADYVADGRLSRVVERVAGAYERWYMNRVDAVVVPSAPARDHLHDLGVTVPVRIVPNGVDVDFFDPGDADGRAFRERHDLGDGPVVGYTGRHGYEKRLGDAVRALDGLEGTVVFGGDGPARDDLESLAAERADSPTEYRFLGFLDREELPSFYAALDVFVFPSPVETQGLVALEANACGTPVVGVDSGALTETIDDGETGYRYEPGDLDGFRSAVERALDDGNDLRGSCLASRDRVSAEHAVDRLSELYADALADRL
jgi:glycosyltransferase involved in cell wall biosynthesis